MFKLPLRIVARLKYSGSLSYSIGLETPDKDVADGDAFWKAAGVAARLLKGAIGREVGHLEDEEKRKAPDPGAAPVN